MNFGNRVNMQKLLDEQAMMNAQAQNNAEAQYLRNMTSRDMMPAQPVPMPMVEPNPNAVPPVPMPMIEPDPNAIPPVPMPMIDPRGMSGADQMMDMTEEDMQKIVEMFKQYMNKSPQVGVPEGQPQQSLEDIIGQAVMGYMGQQ